MGSADRSGAGTEPKIDRLARLLADERVSRRQVLTVGASAVLGITLFEPADTLASIAERAKRCPKGETKCGKKCCAKDHVCCGTTCCAKGDTCKTTHKGRKVTHTCEKPKKELEPKPQCETAADCPAAGAGSCQQATCTSGTCGFAADDSNVPAAAACMTVTCVSGAPQTTPLAAETSCGNAAHTVCDGKGDCVGCASAGDCPAASAGSCQKAVCNSGTCGFTADSTNTPTGTTCTTGTCSGGTPTQQNVTDGTACVGVANATCTAGVCACGSGYANCGSSSDVQCTAVTCNGSTLTTCGTTSSCGPAYTCNSTGDGCNTSCPNGSSDCASGYYCNSSSVCVAKQAQGTTCTTDAACSSNFCVDGYCCATACTGTCMACSAAATGQANGTCANVEAGVSSPDCTATSSSSCGTTGTCNGSGSCAYYPPSTECHAPFCSDSLHVVGVSYCNGSGSCIQPAAISCSPATCSGGACT